ncbi:MAG: hypothetical protein C0606_15805 [Hyphomicrobiales bacterium]|nr:MAG: hypothetical protein C0606_15805 [Hyphomicrobiales bacterium]
MLKKLGRSKWVQRFVGRTLARYLKLVWRTSRITFEPADYGARVTPHAPFIVATWHGQHFVVPLGQPEGVPFHVIVSRSGDGEINAVAVAELGMGLIRASGGKTHNQVARRGGIRGVIEALRVLRDGGSLALTADVPKGPAKVVGPGIIAIAQRSGRPIVPVAFATRWRIDIDSWDKASINLPFSRAAFVVGDPIFVSKDADDETLEECRVKVERSLNQVTERAYDIVDGANG